MSYYNPSILYGVIKDDIEFENIFTQK